MGRRRVALQPHRLVQILTRILDGGDQVEIVRELGHIRQKHVQAAFSSLHAQRWTDQLRSSFSPDRERGQRIGPRGFLLKKSPPPSRGVVAVLVFYGGWR